MAVCMRYMGGGDEVRDVLQDAFIKILTHIANFQYRGEGSLKAWATRIAVNEALDHLRKRPSLVVIGQPSHDVADDDGCEPQNIPPEVLSSMVASLPDGYRTVLNLFVFEQMPHKEIARRLGIAEGTSASQYLRAKKLLQKKIKDYLKGNI